MPHWLIALLPHWHIDSLLITTQRIEFYIFYICVYIFIHLCLILIKPQTINQFMKKTFAFLLLGLMLLGCSNDNNSSNNNNNNNAIVNDIDGNNYETVSICNQVWMKSNLNVSKYTDGTPIPQVTDQNQWTNLTTGAWCYYNNDPANGPIYGKLYNWYAVAGIHNAASASNPALRKKLAPTGWHVPSNAEIMEFYFSCLISQAVAGGKMKATGTIQIGNGLWEEPNNGATNESGFTGLPGGYRTNLGFDEKGIYGMWWNSDELNTTNSYNFSLKNNTNNALLFESQNNIGFSVRCMKN